MPQAPGEPNQLRKCEKLPFAVPLRPRTHHPAARAPGIGARPRSAPRQVVDPAHFGQLSIERVSKCVAIILRTFANRCHTCLWSLMELLSSTERPAQQLPGRRRTVLPISEGASKFRM